MQTFPTTTIFQFLPQLKSTENGIKSTSNPHHHNYYYKERNNWKFFHISPLFFSKRIYLLKLNVENLKTPFRKKNPAKSTKLFSAYSHRRSRNPPHVCHHVFPHTHLSMAANCACHFGNSMVHVRTHVFFKNQVK